MICPHCQHPFTPPIIIRYRCPHCPHQVTLYVNRDQELYLSDAFVEVNDVTYEVAYFFLKQTFEVSKNYQNTLSVKIPPPNSQDFPKIVAQILSNKALL